MLKLRVPTPSFSFIFIHAIDVYTIYRTIYFILNIIFYYPVAVFSRFFDKNRALIGQRRSMNDNKNAVEETFKPTMFVKNNGLLPEMAAAEPSDEMVAESLMQARPLKHELLYDVDRYLQQLSASSGTKQKTQIHENAEEEGWDYR